MVGLVGRQGQLGPCCSARRASSSAARVRLFVLSRSTCDSGYKEYKHELLRAAPARRRGWELPERAHRHRPGPIDDLLTTGDALLAVRAAAGAASSTDREGNRRDQDRPRVTTPTTSSRRCCSTCFFAGLVEGDAAAKMVSDDRRATLVIRPLVLRRRRRRRAPTPKGVRAADHRWLSVPACWRPRAQRPAHQAGFLMEPRAPSNPAVKQSMLKGARQRRAAAPARYSGSRRAG
jgi:hypothetical protein